MNYVEPIKKKNDIKKMYHVLQMKSDRDYLLFKLAIHTGMRLTDLLHLKVEDIKNKENKEIKTAWIQQSAPFIKIMLPSDLRNEIDTYIYELSRQQAYRIIHHAAKELGLLHIGLTTLRKTFAYHAYKSGISIAIIQKYLGHQTTHETLKFIGLSPKEDHHTIIALNL